jgi:hypothetical protein
MENALDVVKRDIFKGTVKPTLLKKSAVVPPNCQVAPIPWLVPALRTIPDRHKASRL